MRVLLTFMALSLSGALSTSAGAHDGSLDDEPTQEAAPVGVADPMAGSVAS